MTDADRSSADRCGRARFVRSLGLDEASVREIHETFGREAAIGGGRPAMTSLCPRCGSRVPTQLKKWGAPPY